MSGTLVITVTEQDILDGVQGSSSGCPIALAMFSAGARRAGASSIEMTWQDADGNYWSGRTPEVAARFISDFDHDEAVFPIEFTVVGSPHERP